MTSQVEAGLKFRDKYQIDLEIHYLQAKLAEDCELVVEARSGKSLIKSTNPVLYSISTSHAFFDSKLSGSIKLIKKGSKYSKKSLKITVCLNKTQSIIGNLAIDLSHLPSLKSPIKKRELNLAVASDKTAVLCISLGISLLHSEEMQRVSKASSSKKQSKTNNEFELESRTQNEDFRSMSFSEFIINPKESDIRSESSSSEEEYKELPADRIQSIAHPKGDKSEVVPNEGSKGAMITDIELKNGIMPTRQKGNCVNCVTF
jgi:hypothetical protein